MDGLIAGTLPPTSFGWLKMWKQKESDTSGSLPRVERIGVDNDVLR